MATPTDVAELDGAVRERYPDLRFITENGRPVFRGSFPIVHEDREIDRFSIEIRFPEGITKPPLIWEIGGRIPRTVNRHVFVGGYICTDVPELTMLRDYSLVSYLDGPVRNYFIGQGLVEQGKPWPFGEWAHGKPGLLQAYGQVLGGISDEQEIRNYLDCLSHKKVKGHWRCPCGSGKQIRQCHVAVVRRLQELIPHRIAGRALERLNSYSCIPKR